VRLPPEAFGTEWGNFRDHHISRGNLVADWPAAWRQWLGNVNQFSRTAGGPTVLSRQVEWSGAKSWKFDSDQAAVAACHVRNASSRRMRSVLRDTRWR
jgi:hypothetical protein